ncbi:MAG: hypothetical protein ACRDSJ_01905 [Rubrobacteraceae bacterium]
MDDPIAERLGVFDGVVNVRGGEAFGELQKALLVGGGVISEPRRATRATDPLRGGL